MSRHGASYRDPAGYVFTQDGVVHRAVQAGYEAHYRHLMDSGLYAALVDKGHLIPHEEVPPPPGYESAWKVLRPPAVSFWSYPYEWSFAQLQAAALHTLRVARIALAHGAILKDASAYNIQFIGGKPVLTDTLSFEVYEAGKPWAAFRQACEHFLYPIVLMSRLRDAGPNLFLAWPDGIPARTVAASLPPSARLRPDYALYVYLPAALGDKPAKQRELKISKAQIEANIDRLAAFIRRLKPASARTVWNHYYEETILSAGYLHEKEKAVEALLARISGGRVLDVGCNTGAFSRIAARYATEVIALDADGGSIDALYRDIRTKRIRNIHPLVADLLYPSPAMGWMNREWSPLLARLSADCVLALAVVHHLTLARNVPLPMIAECFAALTTGWLIVEWIPKSDEKAAGLLAAKGDIFPGYSAEGFEAAFGAYFEVEEVLPLPHSLRVLYVMQRRGTAGKHSK